MKKRSLFLKDWLLFLVLLLLLVGMSACRAEKPAMQAGGSAQMSATETQTSENSPSGEAGSEAKEAPSKEYLFIVTTACTNGVNDDDGINLVIYRDSIDEDKMDVVMDIPVETQYPACGVDVANQIVYFSAGKESDGYDNLFSYDMKTGQVQQLSDGKFVFNDIFLADGKVIVNTAREYNTVTQPAIFDPETREFTYLDPADDDTWFFSLSYDHATDQLLCLTTSDAAMRTKKVMAQTHIRYKTIRSMDTNFQNMKALYSTEAFEIRMTRQLDSSRILMTTDPEMGSGAPRTLKLLDVPTQTVSDFDVPGIREVHSFFPRENAEGVYLLGKDESNQSGMFYYDLKDGSLRNLFDNYPLPDNFYGFVDFIYSVQADS